MSGDILTMLALVLTVVMLVAAVLVLTLKNLIGAVAVSGVVSLGAAILFVMLRAPDVAMTEAAVGAGLSGVVLALGLRRLGLWRLEGDDGRVHPLAPTVDEPGAEPKVDPGIEPDTTPSLSQVARRGTTGSTEAGGRSTGLTETPSPSTKDRDGDGDA